MMDYRLGLDSIKSEAGSECVGVWDHMPTHTHYIRAH